MLVKGALLFADTGSLCYEITTKDFHKADESFSYMTNFPVELSCCQRNHNIWRLYITWQEQYNMEDIRSQINAWISNNIHCIIWDVINHPYPNLTMDE